MEGDLTRAGKAVMDDTKPTEPRSEVVDKLIALARNAHRNVDTTDPIDYWYRLGQRNAYAEAAGLTMAGSVDDLAFTTADRITAALSAGCTDIDELRLRALDLGPGDVILGETQPGLAWIGPQAFAHRFGDLPGVDHDYGTRWGVRGDQRVSLRLEPDATTGLLYVHDATWDEYTVLGTGVPQAMVRAVIDDAVPSPTTPTVEQLAALVRSHAALVRSHAAAGHHRHLEPVVSCGPEL